MPTMFAAPTASSSPNVTAVRPLDPGDFDALVGLYPPEWRFAGASPEEELAQARMDCASLVASCNLRLVAEVAGPDGSPCVAGLLLARVADLPEPSPEDVDVWQPIQHAARAELEAAGTPVANRILRYVDQLAERAALLEEAAGEKRGADNELELFVVGPAARGKGSGSALIAAFERELADRGARSYWLQTDSTCTWEWYERHSYVRVADVELGEGYPMPDAGACAQGVSSQGASAQGVRPHVFMYRKDLASR